MSPRITRPSSTFLRDLLPRIRREFKGRELLIHISPGTPAMQTRWVLLAESGFIEQPFKVVKSYRIPQARAGNRAAVVVVVVEVSLGIESFYKVYRPSRLGQHSYPETAAIWEPSRFRSSRRRALFDGARRYARLKVPVLILGERGTGKTTLTAWLRSTAPSAARRSITAGPRSLAASSAVTPSSRNASATRRAPSPGPRISSANGGQAPGRLAGIGFAPGSSHLAAHSTRSPPCQ